MCEPARTKLKDVGFVQGFMITQQIAVESSDREVQLRTTLRELVIYIVYLILLTIVALGMASSSKYYFTKKMTDLFVDTPTTKYKTFRTSTIVDDFWAFTNTAMMGGFFWEYWYGMLNSTYETNGSDAYILHGNKLLGRPRLRQVKVRSDTCTVHQGVSRTNLLCYDIYNEDAEDTTPVSNTAGSTTAWEYSTESDLEGCSHWGLLTTYGGGGYYIDLPLIKIDMRSQLLELKNEDWITQGTRAIFLDFSVYNANANLFCIVRLVMEIPPTGGLFPTWSFRTVKLIRYVSAFDYFVLACEIMLVLFIIYFIIEELLELKYFKLRYFCYMWNWIDLLIIALAITCIVFHIYRTIYFYDNVEDLLGDDDKYANLESLAFWHIQYNNTIAILLFLSWIKLFKYLSFNKTMTQLCTTISRSAKDVAGFAVTFFIVLLAFAQLGHLLFGTEVKDFSTVPISIFTLLRTILGDFNYEELESANRILGPIFFICYIFFIFFLLLNMFLAIINDTYSEVKYEINSKPHELQVTSFLMRGCNKGREKLPLIKKQKKVQLDRNNLNYYAIRDTLKRYNFTDVEIAMFFAKYNIEEDQEIGEEDASRMLDELDKQNQGIDPLRRYGQSYRDSSLYYLEELDGTNERVTNMEYTIATLVANFEELDAAGDRITCATTD